MTETTDLSLPRHMFHQASNFELHQPVFSTGPVNIYQTASQTTNRRDITDVLQCPAPSQYFVGRQDTLRQLVKIFYPPIVSIWNKNMGTLAHFVRQKLGHKSLVFLDASSALALEHSYADLLKNKNLVAGFILVLENADPSLVLENYLPPPFHVPILVTSTDPAISSWTLHSDHFFNLSEFANYNILVKAIGKSLYPGQRVTTLVANGGSGKTQVVLKFVAMHSSRFSKIWFFDASSDATLLANFKELGKAIGCGEDIKDVCSFLARSHHNWMCIFDNADNQKVDLENYIPRGNYGNIIVTTRLSETSQMNSPGCHIEFRDLDRKNAIKLLLNHACSEISELNVSLGSKIVDALSCHALAVSTAGAYIHANATCTLSNYLTRFNEKRGKLLTYRRKGLDHYEKSIYSAFQVSFDQLSNKTQLLMQICAHFHPNAIPMEIFTRAATFTGRDSETVDLNPPIHDINLMVEFLNLFSEDSTWYDSVDELCKLSLASYEDVGHALSFHSVIHTCAQETIACQEDMRQIAMLLLGRAIPRGETGKEYKFRHNLLLQVSHFEAAKLPTVYVKNGFAQIFSENGRWEAAERLLEEVLLLCKNIIGEHHPDTLISMDNLALTHRERGKLEAAERLQEGVLLLQRETLGEHHPGTLISMNNLALTYRGRGKFEAAEKLQEEVLMLSKKVNGQHHPGTLTYMANLASIYWKRGKMEAAEKLQEKVLLLRKEVIGEDHPDTLTSMHNLAVTYQGCGKLDAAEKLQEQVLRLSKEVTGEHHPETLISMDSLALTYQGRGKLEAAQDLQEEVVSLSKDLNGEHHPDTTSMANLASTYRRRGILEAAEKLEEKVLLLRKEVSGEHHPGTLNSMNNLASTYRGLGKLAEAAEKLQEEVFLLSKEVIGEHHPETLSSMHNLALTYQKRGNLEAAQKLQEKVVLLSKEVIGEQHPDTLISMANLASMHWKCGKFHAAEKLQEEVLLLSKKVIGECHPDTLTSMSDLACTYWRSGKLKAAEKLQEEVSLLRKKVQSQTL